MSDEPDGLGHGNSPAAWTSVIVMLVALTIATFALFFWVPWLLWASGILFLIGAALGPILAKAGYGLHGEKGGKASREILQPPEPGGPGPEKHDAEQPQTSGSGTS